MRAVRRTAADLSVKKQGPYSGPRIRFAGRL